MQNWRTAIRFERYLLAGRDDNRIVFIFVQVSQVFGMVFFTPSPSPLLTPRSQLNIHSYIFQKQNEQIELISLNVVKVVFRHSYLMMKEEEKNTFAHTHTYTTLFNRNGFRRNGRHNEFQIEWNEERNKRRKKLRKEKKKHNANDEVKRNARSVLKLLFCCFFFRSLYAHLSILLLAVLVLLFAFQRFVNRYVASCYNKQ